MSRRSLALAGIAALALLCASGKVHAQDSTETPQAETVAAAPEEIGQPDYDVPLLGISSFRRGADTQLTSQTSGDLAATHASIFVKPLKGGETRIKLRFNNLRAPENGGRYVLWAVGPDKSFTRLGLVDGPDKRLSAKLEARTTLQDFGLLITAESDLGTNLPSGPVAAFVVR